MFGTYFDHANLAFDFEFDIGVLVCHDDVCVFQCLRVSNFEIWPGLSSSELDAARSGMAIIFGYINMSQASAAARTGSH